MLRQVNSCITTLKPKSYFFFGFSFMVCTSLVQQFIEFLGISICWSCRCKLPMSLCSPTQQHLRDALPQCSLAVLFHVAEHHCAYDLMASTGIVIWHLLNVRQGEASQICLCFVLCKSITNFCAYVKRIIVPLPPW